MILFFAFIELVCDYIVGVIARSDRASNAKISSDISVDFEEIMAHIEAVANTFGSYFLGKTIKNNISGFPNFPQASPA